MSAAYESELGQAIFGNATALGLGDSEGMVANELYALSEALGKRDPEAQAHGLLGGEWGYGQDFTNAVFEMHPYWWDECECGFDEAESTWEDEHPHTAECWQVRYRVEDERLHGLGLKWEERHKQLDAWAEANGWNGRPGVAVHCDCGTLRAWRKWRGNHGHDSACRVVLPNFRCGDVSIHWYKYIGRGMSVNREVSRAEWRDIFARCFDSITGAVA